MIKVRRDYFGQNYWWYCFNRFGVFKKGWRSKKEKARCSSQYECKKERNLKIDAHKKELEAKIQETRVKNEQEYKESLNQLSSLYEKNKDEWVSTIVNRCKEI